MTITKKTRLLARPAPIVSLSNLTVRNDGSGSVQAAVDIANCEGVKGYAKDTFMGSHTLKAQVSVNGGEPTEETFGCMIGDTRFIGLVAGATTGDSVKVKIEIDPSKADGYSAGTMERSATVS